jgi:hypothetical protein
VVRHREHNKKLLGVRSHHSSLNSNESKSLLNNGEHKHEERRRRKSLDHVHLKDSFRGWEGDLEEEDEEEEPVVLLTSTCRMQVRAYVRRIASMYHENRYHALEHAVHVTMSANKLLDMLHQDDEDPDKDPTLHSLSNPGKGKFASSVGPTMNASEHGLNYRHSTSSGSTDSESVKAHPEADNESAQKDETQPSGKRVAPRSKTDALRSSLMTPMSPNHFKTKVRMPKRLRPSFSQVVYSDTFTKFSFVFAAIIHDVDHQGVPNATLVQENDPIALQYDGKSVAEKHSIKVAFRTLSESGFEELRSVIFGSPDDRLHMHHIVTNLVISTDIASPERAQSTKLRWEEAFSKPIPPSGPLPFGRLSLAMKSSSATKIATVTASEPKLVSIESSKMPMYKQNESEMMASSICEEGRRNNIKRSLQLNGGQTVEYFTSSNQEDSQLALRHSVVIETMLNVADVAHSMQSWELFLFWNHSLFEELYDAFLCGRSENDPCNGWYENQLKFYKFYVLPLAEKMQKVVVFGDAGSRFFKNALSIRDQWEREGEKMTRDMIEAVTKKCR